MTSCNVFLDIISFDPKTGLFIYKFISWKAIFEEFLYFIPSGTLKILDWFYLN